jgi:hypothetical protein
MKMLWLSRLAFSALSVLLLGTSGFASGYTYTSASVFVPGSGQGTFSGGGSTGLVSEPSQKLFGVFAHVIGEGGASISGTVTFTYEWSGDTVNDDPVQDAALMPSPASRVTGFATRSADDDGLLGSSTASSTAGSKTGSKTSPDDGNPAPYSDDAIEQSSMSVYFVGGTVYGKFTRSVSATGSVTDPASGFLLYDGEAYARGLARRRDTLIEL